MLEWNFYLEGILPVQAEIQVGCRDIDDRRECRGSAIKAELHGIEPELYFLIIGLIGFHCTHRAKPGIAAALREGRKGDEENEEKEQPPLHRKWEPTTKIKLSSQHWNGKETATLIF